MRLDRAPPAALHRPVGIGHRHVADDARDAAEQDRNDGERMHGKIVERAIAGFCFVLPEEHGLRIGHEVLVHLDAQLGDGADRAVGEQAAHVPHRGALDVVVAQHRHLAARPRGHRHAFGIREGGRHRLLTPDMLAGFEGRDYHFGMEFIGCGNRHDIDLRIGYDHAPVARRPCKAELIGASAREIGIHLREMGKHDRGHVGKDGPDRLPGQRMAFAHEAGADQTHADIRGHVLSRRLAS